MHLKLNCVLLIDDNDDDNFYHQIILRESAITDHVHVAENGFEALRFLQSAQIMPELIFLDINMPRMNGWEFLERYRNLDIEEKEKVVIIMLTTSLNPADATKAKLIPEISSFQPKPLTHEMILQISERFFRDRQTINVRNY